MACPFPTLLDTAQQVCDNTVVVEFWWTRRSKRVKRTFEGSPASVDASIREYTNDGFIVLNTTVL